MTAAEAHHVGVMTASQEQEVPLPEAGLADLPKPWLKQLISHHLSNAERLNLFRASRSSAAAVVQHATAAVLRLDSGQQPEHNNSTDTGGMGNRHNLPVIYSIATGSSNLHLSVHNSGLQSPVPKHLWPVITQLTLAGAPLNGQFIQNILYLPQLQSLRTLAVVQPGPGPCQATGAVHLAAAATGLMHLCNLRYEGPSESEVCHSLEALGAAMGSQITHLVINQMGALCTLPKFPALQQLQVRHTDLPINTLPAPSKQLVEQLLSHPRLTHVTLPSWPCNMDEAQQLRTKPCDWQLLHLTQPVDVEVLSVLPLHGIKRLRLTRAVHQFFSDQQITEAALSHISQNVECEPVTGNTDSEALGIPAEVPMFSITPQDPTLVAIFARTLHGALQLHWFDVGRDALSILSQLPHAIHTLCLSNWFLQGDCTWEDVFRALPPHLCHLVINSSGLSREEVLSLFDHLPTNLTELTLGPAFFPPSSRTELEEQVRMAARACGVRFKWCRRNRPYLSAGSVGVSNWPAAADLQ